MTLSFEIWQKKERNGHEGDKNRRKKSDFDDNSWITQKAIEQWNAHTTYKDVYKMVNKG